MTDPATPQQSSAPSGDPVAAGYAEALLRELDTTDVDVDVLATQVQRAAALIGFCRDRIGAARVQIEQAVAELGVDR
jgi:exodeoxyribonuclease VII small subunit